MGKGMEGSFEGLYRCLLAGKINVFIWLKYFDVELESMNQVGEVDQKAKIMACSILYNVQYLQTQTQVTFRES